ncbi:MAG: lysostaphin resistance A-like protein [Spirosomataceae bacterium]
MALHFNTTSIHLSLYFFMRQPVHILDRTVLSSLLILIGFVMVGMVIGNLVGSYVMVALTNLSLSDLSDLEGALREAPNGWFALIVSQAIVSLSMFTGAGLLYWYWIEKQPFSTFHTYQTPSPSLFLFVYIIQIVSMPFSSWVQSANAAMKLPASLQAIESYMRAMEDKLGEMTTFMTTYDSFGQFILTFLVIGCVAGFGEELIFRGLLQRKLVQAWQNHHLAIWVSAFVFSAIHFQFYGFFPRLFLGALFGYFYYWSGNLWIPIAAHVFNNGTAVLVMYLIHLKKISPELEKMDSVPAVGVIASALLTGLGLWYFRHFVKQERKS